jgi:hypothetical protein
MAFLKRKYLAPVVANATEARYAKSAKSVKVVAVASLQNLFLPSK